MDPSVAQFPYLNSGDTIFKKKCDEICIENKTKVIDRDIIIKALKKLEADIDFWKFPRKLCTIFRHNAEPGVPIGPWSREYILAASSPVYDKKALISEMEKERDQRVAEKTPTIFTSDPSGKGKNRAGEPAPQPPKASSKPADKSLDPPHEQPEDGAAHQSAKGGGSKKVKKPADAGKPQATAKPPDQKGDGAGGGDKPKRFEYVEDVIFQKFDREACLFVLHMEDKARPVYALVPKADPDFEKVCDELKDKDFIPWDDAARFLGTDFLTNKDPATVKYLPFVQNFFSGTEEHKIAQYSFRGERFMVEKPYKNKGVFPDGLVDYQVPKEAFEKRISRAESFLHDCKRYEEGNALGYFAEYYATAECMQAYEGYLDKLPLMQSMERHLEMLMKNPFPLKCEMDDIDKLAQELIESRFITEEKYQEDLTLMRMVVMDAAGIYEGRVCCRDDMESCMENFLRLEKGYSRERMIGYLDHRDQLLALANKMDDMDFLLGYESEHGEPLRETLLRYDGIWHHFMSAYDLAMQNAKILQDQRKAHEAALKEQRELNEQLQAKLLALQKRLSVDEDAGGAAPGPAAGGSGAPPPAEPQAAAPGPAAGGSGAPPPAEPQAAAPGSAAGGSGSTDAAPPKSKKGKRTREPSPSDAINLVSAAASRRQSRAPSRRGSRAASPDPQDLMVDGPRERRQNLRFKP